MLIFADVTGDEIREYEHHWRSW